MEDAPWHPPVNGWIKPHERAEWVPVVLELAESSLSISSADGSIGIVSDLRAVQSLEKDGTSNGVTTVTLTDPTQRLSLAWPDAFSSALVTWLQRAQGVSAEAAHSDDPPGAAEVDVAAQGARRRGGRTRQLVMAGLVVALVATAVMAGLGYKNGRGWQRRAEKAESGLTTTKATLKSTNADLASTTSDLTSARSRVVQVEAEKSDIERRVTELSNEKAQVQDERNVAQEVSRLGSVAVTDLTQCMSDISDALGSYSVYSSAFDRAEISCDQAGDSVAAFRNALS